MSQIVFGNPDAGIAFGNPDASPQIAFGIPEALPKKGCIRKLLCPCSDNPLENLSEEDTELQFINHGFGGFCDSAYACDSVLITACAIGSQADADANLANDLLAYNDIHCPPPPIANFCATATCPDGTSTVTACSPYSQADAQAEASRLAALQPCPPSLNDPPTEPGPVFFFNTAQTCTIHCPDGLPFNYTVAAGRYVGNSQAQANGRAHQVACIQAQIHIMCLSALVKEWCSGTAFDETISATNADYPTFNFWQITNGSLPDGLQLIINGSPSTGGYTQSSVHITGTPTTPGAYNFTLQISNPVGDFMAKTYTICIIGQTSNPVGDDADHLPDASRGAIYSVTIQPPACATGPFSFQLKPGDILPTGLFLAEDTGIISGTATVKGTYTFTIILQTEAT